MCVCVRLSACVSVSVYSRRFAFHAAINKMNWKSKKSRNRKRGRRKRERESSSGRACRQDNRLVELADSLVVLHPVFQWKSKHFVKRKHTNRQREGQLYTHTHTHTEGQTGRESRPIHRCARLSAETEIRCTCSGRAQDVARTRARKLPTFSPNTVRLPLSPLFVPPLRLCVYAFGSQLMCNKM